MFPYYRLTKSFYKCWNNTKTNTKTKYNNFSTLIIPQIIKNGTSSAQLHQSVLNLTSAAHQIEKDEIHLLLYSNGKVSNNILSEAKRLKNVTKVLTYYTENENSNPNLNEPSGEILSSLVAAIHSNINKYDNIITSSNNFGKNFLPRIGGILDIQPISDVCKVENDTFSRYFYAGNILSKLESTQKPNIMTIRLTSFDKSIYNETENTSIEVTDLSRNEIISRILLSTPTSKFIENISNNCSKTELSQAKVVISGGRALKSAENFKLLDDLASCFEGSAIGASRAAVDAGYVANDLQIGQTGKVVAPELYIAIGISGAIQHVAGMKDSKVIVAINKDADCPIFQIATYGLVGDLFKVVPELTEKIKKMKN